MPRRARVWALAGAAGIVLFLLGYAMRPIDEAIGRALVGAPGLVRLAEGLAFLGAFSFLGPLLLGVALAIGFMGRRWGAARILFVLLFAEGASRVLKLVFARPRPAYQLADAAGYSFPSGHATLGAALAVLLVWFALRHLEGRGLALATLGLAVAWAIAMAFSRLVLGVHYPGDVLAGVGVGTAVGGFVLAASILVERRVDARGAARRDLRAEARGPST